MKGDHASAIGERIVISFPNQKIVLSEIYPIGTTIEEVRHVIENVRDDLRDLGHISSWGLERVYNIPSGYVEHGEFVKC